MNLSGKLSDARSKAGYLLVSGGSLRTPWAVLDTLPRAPLGLVESPIEEWKADGVSVWVKRDDRNTPVMGGNKARALELLLAGLQKGDRVATVGGVGSTHILATAVHAARLGAVTRCWRWPHELHPVATRVADAIAANCESSPVLGGAARALAAAFLRDRRARERWVPFGGTSAVGMVGHMKAALEFALQVERADCPAPSMIFVPLGTGGTATGLAVGLATAGLKTRVMAVRCGPRTGVDAAWLAWLSWHLRRRVERLGVSSDQLPPASVTIVHDVFAGAYARPHPGAEALAATLEAHVGAGLDATYSAKACYAAFQHARSSRTPVLFWHTFDARWLSRP